MDKHILFLDVETTGTGSSARIVQMAWLIHDMEGKELKSESHIIYPDGFEIPEQSTEIHGITTQYALDNGEDLEMILLKFRHDLMSCNLLVGHNISFDVRMVTYELMRTGMPDKLREIEKVCTMHKSTEYCAIPSSKRYFKKPRLQELHSKLFGDNFEGAHDALADIQATARCYWQLKKLGVINPIIL